jgi:hypothetical protein
MKEYVSTVIDKMREAKLFAPQGGPIILAQVMILPHDPFSYRFMTYIYIHTPYIVYYYVCNTD